MSAKTMIARRVDRAVKRSTRAAIRKRKRETPARRHMATVLFAMRLRGRARRELAARVGTFILNEIEHGGQCHIEDYSKITPAWAVSYYLGIRRPR